MRTRDGVRVIRWQDLPGEQVLPGIQRQRVDGDKATVVRYTYEPGSVFPAHSHSEEQVTTVLSGEIEFEVSSTRLCACAGSVVVIPSGAVHGARVIGDEKAETLNALAPRRTQQLSFVSRGDDQ